MNRGVGRGLPARAIGVAMAATALAACGGTGPLADGAIPGQRTAALARLIIDNRTDHALSIAFRYATEPDGEIVVGTAAPRALTETAPVPAAEPIVLIARGPGFERRLRPPSLEIDEVWTWVVGADSARHGR